MRSWLNCYGAETNLAGKDFRDGFINNNAFSKAEQSAIRTTNIVNDSYGSYGDGKETPDKVFLLSAEEVKDPIYGFLSNDRQSDGGRRAKNTTYAQMQGAYTETSEAFMQNGGWWLRTLGGTYDRSARYVNYAGEVGFYRYGYFNRYNHDAVRPALYLDLSSALGWSYAGTVSSDGAVTPSPDLPPSVTPVVRPSTAPTFTPAVSTATPKQTEKPSESPTESPVLIDKPTEKPGITPTASPKPEKTEVPLPGVTTSPFEDPATSPTPEPVQQPQITISPSVTTTPTAPDPEETDIQNNDEVTPLKKGRTFIAGNLKYKITKLNGKKGEVAIAGMKSKRSKSIVIHKKVKKEGFAFTITSIQKNAFKGCSRVKVFTIKATDIKRIDAKVMNGLKKRIQVKIPRTKATKYGNMLRKLGYRKIKW